ncbi:MAG: GntG family PLP-dependent aldolase [Planctomycetota bacterium]
MKRADFRSDTVTKPTPEMRRAMFEAVVGDDVFGDDPTVNELQARAARIFGTGDSLFVPSGTMGNQVSIKVLTRAGTEIICESGAHIFLFEGGALGLISGVQVRTLTGVRGRLDIDQVRQAIRSDNVHYPRTSLVAVENTHNMAGGAVIPLEDIDALWRLTREQGVALYIDGARIFNASVASGVPVREYAARCDLMSFCLSKGLGAPVGSLIVGSKERIAEARRVRKCLGGGMRQAGVLAAPAIIALEEMPPRLAADHERAQRLARGLAVHAVFSVDPAEVETNIVVVGVPVGRAGDIVQMFGGRGIDIVGLPGDRVRFVTHHQVDDSDVLRALEAAAEIAQELG